jgi:hypothetical protein
MESTERNGNVPALPIIPHRYPMRSIVKNLQKMLSVHSELDLFERFA